MGRYALLLAAALCCCAVRCPAHSGKARFHVIIDTDGAADDLRTICMLLGNREVEVLAITTSEGALTPDSAASSVASLLAGLYHEGIPVGAGRSVGAPAPEWRSVSQRIRWGDARDPEPEIPEAADAIAAAIADEPEKIVFVALGAMTNIADALARDPSLGGHILRIVWYDNATQPPSGANCLTDSVSARRVLESGIPVTIVSENTDCPIVITPALLDSIASAGTPYARRIVDAHRSQPLSRLIDEGHLHAWDDLTAVYLFAPELFEECGGSASAAYRRPIGDTAAIVSSIARILRGKPDSESRVFYGFPTDSAAYAADVAPIVAEAVARHGASEWRAGVLTNELHGHLGIYATVGVKMGIRAREFFDIGVDDIRVTSYAGSRPPVSCMNDGLQVSTGATAGHGLLSVEECAPPRPEARFTFKGRTLVLRLKPEYADRIRREVRRGEELYGDRTEEYWQYVRDLAIGYWLDWDRHEMFDMEIIGK